jgi:hypothetical protein
MIDNSLNSLLMFKKLTDLLLFVGRTSSGLGNALKITRMRGMIYLPKEVKEATVILMIQVKKKPTII